MLALIPHAWFQNRAMAGVCYSSDSRYCVVTTDHYNPPARFSKRGQGVGLIFSVAARMSVVIDPNTGKVVISIAKGARVDALGWDLSIKLIFIPNGGEGNVIVLFWSPDRFSHEDSYKPCSISKGFLATA
jgi:hypothetical protein